MDYSNPLGIEYRVVENAEYQGQPVRIVGGSRIYNTDIEDLWDAVTNAERIPRWFAPVSGELNLGGRYQIEGNAGGEVTRCDAPSAFDLTWEYAGNVSWVNVRLESVDGGTRLTLKHLMGKDEASEGHWKTYGPGATGVGWDLSFLGLGLHLNSGESVNLDEGNEWMGSEDGKAFMKLCARAWGAAHVSAGEEASIAEAMAAATGAAYCGEQQADE